MSKVIAPKCRLRLKLLAAFAMFLIGAGIDAELRTHRSGITDCFCTSFKCRIVTLADNPKMLLENPIEVVTLVLETDY